MSRRQFGLRAGALGLSLTSISAILAACSSSTSSQSTTPRSGGTFIEGYDRDFSKITTVNAAWIDPTQEPLNESLLMEDPQGKVVPNLAESWTTNADKSVWTFKLRSGLKFQSGAPVTAANVVEDFNQYKSPAGQNAPWWSSVTDIKATDDRTVVVTSNTPFAAFPDTLRNEFSNVINYATVKSAGDNFGVTVTDGTGPFKLKEYAPDHVTVTRWDGYAGSIVPWFQNKGKAYLDGIKFVSIKEASNRANEILSNNVHALKNPLPQDLDSIKSNNNYVVIENQDASAVTFGLVNTKTNLGFDDLRVRQAISHAIDRQAIVRTILFGHGVATFGPFPTAYKWYEKGVEQFNQFDVSKANSLLDAAGWTKGSDGIRQKNGNKLAFKISNFSEATRNRVGDAVVGMLHNVGINATMNNQEAGAFFTGLTSADAFFFQWLWMAPPNIYDVLCHSDFRPAPNWALANIPSVNQALDAWRHAKDDSELQSAAKQIQLQIAENLPTLTLYTPNVVWVHHKKVHGWRPTTTNLYPFYNDVWLES
jgi:peptide/nickel transport system substrate-binding protein